MRPFSLKAALVVALATGSAGFRATCQHMLAVRSIHRAAPLALVESEPPATKITIKPPSSSSASAATAAAGDSGTKVTVRVRSPSERAAAAAAPAPAAEDDSMTVSSVTVKAPKVVRPPPPPPAPAGPKLSEAEELLLSSVQKANCSAVLDALQQGANPNVRDPKGRTPLHFIAGVGLAPAAVLLIHFGAQIDALDADGLTPMHMAAGYANAQSLRVLVAAGADTEVRAQQQGTPYEVVCALGDFQLKQVYETRKDLKNRFKKKDEKLEKLRACMDVLDDTDAVRQEADWDEMLKEVMKAIGGPNDSNVL